MKDRDFLIWLHARLHNHHGESELVDYMHKLRAIIAATPSFQETPNDGRGLNSLDALLPALGINRLGAIVMGVRKGGRSHQSHRSHKSHSRAKEDAS